MIENEAIADLLNVKRVTEPELMDDPMQVEIYACADFSEGDKSFLSSIEQCLIDAHKTVDIGTTFVDLGCGPGNITDLIARRWPKARVIGVDGSEFMLSAARRRQSQLPFSLSGLSYRCLEIRDLGNKSTFFDLSADVLVSNSLLHHLHDPSHLWKAVKSIANQGAIVLHRDLRRPFNPNEAVLLQEKYLPNAPEVLIRDYLASLHAAFTIDEVRIQLDNIGLERFKVRELDDRYLEVIGIF